MFNYPDGCSGPPAAPLWDDAACDAERQTDLSARRFNEALPNKVLGHKFISAVLDDPECGEWTIRLQAPPATPLDERTTPADFLDPLWSCLMAIGVYGDADQGADESTHISLEVEDDPLPVEPAPQPSLLERFAAYWRQWVRS